MPLVQRLKDAVGGPRRLVGRVIRRAVGGEREAAPVAHAAPVPTPNVAAEPVRAAPVAPKAAPHNGKNGHAIQPPTPIELRIAPNDDDGDIPEHQRDADEAKKERIRKALAAKAEREAAAKAEAPAAKVGGLLAAARQASETGMSTATQFRLVGLGEQESEHEEHAEAVASTGHADAVIGESWDMEIRTGDDGVAYAGPIDNPSARARAAGKRLDIDRDECIGCGTCVEHIDTVFWLKDDEGKAYVLTQDGRMDRIEDAIDACPVTCISWQDA